MSEYAYGPVEFFVIEFSGEEPDRGVFRALAQQHQLGVVRPLDMVIAHPKEDGSLSVQELSATPSWSELGVTELEVQGLISSEDIEEAFAGAQQGMSVAVVALEHSWALQLAQEIKLAKARVVRSERIAAADVNHLIADALEALDRPAEE